MSEGGILPGAPQRGCGMAHEAPERPPRPEAGSEDQVIVLMGLDADELRAIGAFTAEIERIARVRFLEAASVDGGLARIGLLRGRGAACVGLIGAGVGERDLLRAVRALAGGGGLAPAILLATPGQDELIAKGIAAKACDFVLRSELDADRLLRSVRLGVATARLELAERQARTDRELDEARFATIWELIPDGMLLVDGERRIRRFNRAALELLGLSEDELAGAAFGSLRWSELGDGPRVEETFGRSEAVLAFERRDGVTLHIGLRVRTLDRNPEGVRWRAVLMRDRSERVARQSILGEARHFAGLGRLLAGAAHDCNNLLTPLLGFCELLVGSTAGDPRSQGYAREVERSARLLAELVRRLLDESRSRPEAQRIHSPDRAVQDLVSLLRSLVGPAIDLSTDLAAPEAQINLRQGQVEQIVLNLAANARDAMPLGGRLSIRTRPLPERRWALEVADTGGGIAPEHLGRVFDPAFTTKALGKGTGLGLWIVRAIAEEAGGKVEVKSELGRGTTVRVELPTVAAGDQPSGEISLR